MPATPRSVGRYGTASRPSFYLMGAGTTLTPLASAGGVPIPKGSLLSLGTAYSGNTDALCCDPCES